MEEPEAPPTPEENMKLLILLVLLVTSCGREETSQTKTILGDQSSDLGNLGGGYDLVKGRFTGNRCFQGGEIQDQAGSEASLSIERNLSYEDLNKELSGSLSIKVNVYPGIKATGQASFASENASSKFTETFTLIFRASSSQHRLYLDDPTRPEFVASPVLQRIFDAKEEFQWSQETFENELKRVCGDEYIAYIEKGMSLIATLKFEFANEYDKKAFGGSIGVEVLEGVASGNIDVGFEKIKSNSKVNISLSAIQKGGQGLELLKVLSSGDQNETDPVLQCTMDNREKCINIFRNILNHAKTLGDKADRGENFHRD